MKKIVFRLPQELLLPEHVSGCAVAVLSEEQTVQEGAGHFASAPLQLRHTVFHLSGEHSHPLRCELCLVEEASHPGHRRAILGRHGLENEEGGLAVVSW